MDRSRRSGHGPLLAGSPGVFCLAGPECFSRGGQSKSCLLKRRNAFNFWAGLLSIIKKDSILSARPNTQCLMHIYITLKREREQCRTGSCVRHGIP